jgi:hypothetical protein
MVEKLKEIKEKLNLLIQEVEQLENSIHGEEIILERKDFKFLKRIGERGSFQVFQFFEDVVFDLAGEDNPNYVSCHYKYQYSIFKALIEGNLDRIILIKRKEKLQTKDGFLITHDVEKEVDTKLRDNYRNS